MMPTRDTSRASSAKPSRLALFQTAAKRFRALGDLNRIRVLHMLVGGEMCVWDMVEELQLPQPLLSFHLRILKEAGLVLGRRDGRWAYYRLNLEVLAELRRMTAGLVEGKA